MRSSRASHDLKEKAVLALRAVAEDGSLVGGGSLSSKRRKVATLFGVPESSLRRWDDSADRSGALPADRSGGDRRSLQYHNAELDQQLYDWVAEWCSTRHRGGGQVTVKKLLEEVKKQPQFHDLFNNYWSFWRWMHHRHADWMRVDKYEYLASLPHVQRRRKTVVRMLLQDR